ncbi:multicopper oxidase family protein [Streptomyces sp. BR1]|uniref:multicopper oxidase family protein n=1 Tax=Streptomyces sp. BR1 TaxID=1592323 RepID=UPI00402B739E
MSRRGFLGASGAALLAASGCGVLTREVSGRTVRSRARLPEPFRVPLPRPVVAKPLRTTDGTAYYELVQREARIEILPGLRTAVWGYDGRFPGTLIEGRSGHPVVVRVRNELPVPTSTHLHGGLQAPESDGYPTDLLVPDGYQHMADGGSMGSMADMPSMRVAPEDWTYTRGSRIYRYPLDQPAATLWYHDHRMGFSAPQVWRGLAGMFLVRDGVEDALPLPKGDKDIPLMICDRSFDEDGSLSYPSLDPSLTQTPGVREEFMSGVTGDVVLVNGAPWPELEVSGTRHRLRILNASNARRYQLALEPGPRDGSAFTQIGSDMGLLEHPVRHDVLPVSPGERFDVVVDFAAFPYGSTVTLVNALESGGSRNVMRFRISRREREESAPVPELLARAEAPRTPSPAAVRKFDFRRTNGDGGAMWTINGEPFDSAKSLAAPGAGTVERWRFSSDFHHPVHLHLARFRVVARDGKAPRAADAGWKDTVDVRPYEVVDVLARFAPRTGRSMIHCHNLEHEDMAMMANFEIV